MSQPIIYNKFKSANYNQRKFEQKRNSERDLTNRFFYFKFMNDIANNMLQTEFYGYNYICGSM